MTDLGVPRTRGVQVLSERPNTAIVKGIELAGQLYLDQKQKGIQSDLREDLDSAMRTTLSEQEASQSAIEEAANQMTLPQDVSNPEVREMMGFINRNNLAARQTNMSMEAAKNRNDKVIGDYLKRYPHLADQILRTAGPHTQYSPIAREIARNDAYTAAGRERMELRETKILEAAKVLGVPTEDYFSDSPERNLRFARRYAAASEANFELVSTVNRSQMLDAENKLDKAAIKTNTVKAMSAINTGVSYIVGQRMFQFTGANSPTELAAQLKQDPTMLDDLALAMNRDLAEYQIEIRNQLDPRGLLSDDEWTGYWRGTQTIVDTALSYMSSGSYLEAVEAASKLDIVTRLQEQYPDFAQNLYIIDMVKDLAQIPGMSRLFEELGDDIYTDLVEFNAAQVGMNTKTYGKGGPLPGANVLTSPSNWKNILPEETRQLLGLQQDKKNLKLLKGGPANANPTDAPLSPEQDELIVQSAAQASVARLIQNVNAYYAALDTGNEAQLWSAQDRDSVLGNLALNEFKEMWPKISDERVRSRVMLKTDEVLRQEVSYLTNTNFNLILEPILRRRGATVVTDNPNVSVLDNMLNFIAAAGTSGTAPMKTATLPDGTPVTSGASDNKTFPEAREFIEVNIDPTNGQVGFSYKVPAGFPMSEDGHAMFSEAVAQLNEEVAAPLTQVTRAMAHIQQRGYLSTYASIAVEFANSGVFNVKYGE